MINVRMRMFARIALFALLGAICGGCATIFNCEASGDLLLDSSEEDTKVTIYYNDFPVGIVRTPLVYHVEASGGYLRRSSYEFVFEKPGFEKETFRRVARFSGWYWGNIVLGGVIGLFVVDPLTDSVYKIDVSPINANMRPKAR